MDYLAIIIFSCDIAVATIFGRLIYKDMYVLHWAAKKKKELMNERENTRRTK